MKSKGWVCCVLLLNLACLIGKTEVQSFVIVVKVVWKHDTGLWSARSFLLDLGPKNLCCWSFLIRGRCILVVTVLYHFRGRWAMSTHWWPYQPYGVQSIRFISVQFHVYSRILWNNLFLDLLKDWNNLCDSLLPHLFMIHCERTERRWFWCDIVEEVEGVCG